MKWINIKDQRPKHMQQVRVFIENPYFGSFERNGDAVFLWFRGDEQGSFYDSDEQIHLNYVTKWKPIQEKSDEVD